MMKNNSMTQEEMNDFADILAEKVFKLIMERQKELDEQFIEQVKQSGANVEVGLQPYFGMQQNASNEEVLLSELARLMTLLSSYEEREQYEKAAIINGKIKHIENKLKKLMIKPMLAHKVNENRIDFSEEVFIQPKLDGVRCIFTKDGAYSRTGKQFHNLRHIELRLKGFFKLNPDIQLDGELYNHALRNDFEQIISLVRKQKPTDEDRRNAQHLIQYHVYDMIAEGLSYEDRLNWLMSNKVLWWGNVVVPVETHRVNKYEEAANMHYDGFLKQGYEGSILRLNGPYEQKRSYNLQKFKDFSDTEATIIGYEAGKGKFTGLIGKFLMIDDNGVEFGCPIGKGYNYDDRRFILNNIHDYIGKRATFTYFERTKAGSYRHPLYKTIRNYE